MMKLRLEKIILEPHEPTNYIATCERFKWAWNSNYSIESYAEGYFLSVKSLQIHLKKYIINARE